MRRRRSAVLPLGSIISGTMRERDLIPEFLYYAERLHLSRAERAAVREIAARIDGGVDEYGDSLPDGYFDSDDAAYDLEELFDLLSEHVPDYCYFGAHPGDGSDFGVWVSWEAIEDSERVGELLRVDGLDEVPRRHSGYVLAVTDHGNATLYLYSRGRGREVWGVV